MSRTACRGCRSQGMLGNQLRSTRTIRTPLYSSSHLAMPLATTVRGVLTDPGWLIAAKNKGPAATTNLPFNAATSSLSAEEVGFGNCVAVRACPRPRVVLVKASEITAAAIIARDITTAAAGTTLLTREPEPAAAHTGAENPEIESKHTFPCLLVPPARRSTPFPLRNSLENEPDANCVEAEARKLDEAPIKGTEVRLNCTSRDARGESLQAVELESSLRGTVDDVRDAMT